MRSIVGVHLARRDDVVGQLLGRELAVGEDRLARAAVPDEAREPQVRGAGDDPLVAGGERAAAALSARMWSTVEQQLAAAADRERLRRRDPQLLRSPVRLRPR